MPSKRSSRRMRKTRRKQTQKRKQRGGTLEAFKKACMSREEAGSSGKWASVMLRLNGEIRKMSSPAAKAELESMGIHIKYELTDTKTEFYAMIQNKDAGPYTYVPMCFVIRPCVKAGGAYAYPMIPPIVEFMSFTPSRIHPNLKPTGDVCLSILEYSYVGPSASGWNPLTSIDKLIINIGTLLTDKALKYEPGLESAKNEDTAKYDAHVEYLGLKEIVRTYTNLLAGTSDSVALKHFSDELRRNAKDALETVIRKTTDKGETNLPKSIFIESMKANYASLHEKATELLASF